MRGDKEWDKMKEQKIKSLKISDLIFICVIRLGLEPKTPTLKVLCSTY